jgi:hypothetical protein
MLKLISEEGTKWSYLNGYNIFGNVVWLSDKDDIRKYTLLNEAGDKINVDIKNFLAYE